ncbi:anaerobic benzoate catabolism transcriptional regulator (plasmid) [Corynebacterium faecale]|uniref:helix-turn-helix domain-containing protein n=1 Tax=Corynebacterium faecale TaxID=1758466 RepID=UPI0025B40963|nr:helix-turn-helix transcriptional regulator [Corynebacterium faecale]WJY93521.1 anaerobic benzoate catabolism transcriptional regulator [Corynebacterium faecale]
MQLGDRLREARKQAKLSQEEVAHLSGLHRTYISLVERGGRNISVLNLLSITGVLGIDAGDIINGLTREPRIKP